MKKILALAVTTAIIVSATIHTGVFAAAPKTYNVTLLPETYQEITGWGVYPCSVPNPEEDWWSSSYAVHNAIFDDLGINMYRVELKGNCGDSNGNLVEKYMAMFRNSIKIAKNHDITDYLLSIWTPPAGMKTNNAVSGKNEDGTPATLLPDYEQKFCDYIVNVLKDLESNDLPLL